MLKMIAASTAVGMLIAVAPAPQAEARVTTETYWQCVHNAYAGCTPQGPGGPYLPQPGSPEEEAYLQCLSSWLAYCETLPDAPGG